MKFEKRFGSSAPDLTHQLNFQLAVQGSRESLHQWSDRVLTLATRWRRQWTICSFTSTLASSVPHSLSMRW